MRKRIIAALMCVVSVSMSTGTVSAKTAATYKTNPFVQEAKEYLENADSDDRYADYSVGELAEKLEESKGWMDKLSKFCKPVTEEKVREQGLDPDNLPSAADLAPYLNVANNITGNKTAKTFCSDPKEALKSLTLKTSIIIVRQCI